MKQVFLILLLFLSATVFSQETNNEEKQDSVITLIEFNKRVGNKEKAVLVYFSAEWCAVCIKMKSVIAQIEKDCANKMVVLKIDTERDKEITNEFEINALPVLMLYKKGCNEWIHVGLLDLRILHSEIDPFLSTIVLRVK